jgi:hypothetical protein
MEFHTDAEPDEAEYYQFAIREDAQFPRKPHYNLHHEPENWLSNRARTLFGQENKILLFDLSNTYFVIKTIIKSKAKLLSFL